MTHPEFAAGSERLSVGVGLGLSDFAGRISTSFNVKRYDEEMASYAMAKLGYGDWLPPLTSRGITPDEFASVGIRPYSETQEDDCNLVVQAGWVALLGGIAGTSITNKFSATQGRIGVGTGATAAAYANTTLVGDTGGSSTTSYFQLVSSAPTIATGSSPPTLVLVAAFAGGNANFAWAEFGSDNWNASGVTSTGLGANDIFFNRGVSSQGTKASGQVWTATETISFGYPSGAGTVS
jgi:hypothetical protein